MWARGDSRHFRAHAHAPARSDRVSSSDADDPAADAGSGRADVMPAHACRFETDLMANPGGPGGHGATVRTLKRVLPDTEQQARDIEKFCPRHYSAEGCG